MSLENNNIYYNYGPILSHNCLFNYIIGDRGGGKTYGAKKLVLDDFLSMDNEFMWVRRYGTELKPKDEKENSPMLTFFNDLIQNNEYPEHQFEIKNSAAYVDGRLCGYFTALNGQSKKKSVPYPKVRTIVFDEFLIDDRKKNLKYLPNEAEEMLSLIDTVFRLRDDGVRVIFIGNSLSFNNPYFIYWKILPFKEGFKKDKDRSIIVHLWHNENLKQAKLSTRLGRAISGTHYGEMSMNNNFYLDNDNFIEPFNSKNKEYTCTLAYNQHKIGIWFDRKKNLYYISEEVNPTFKMRYAITDEEHNIDYTMCDTIKHTIMKKVIYYHNNSRIRYSSSTIKYLMYEIFTLI